VGSSTMAKSSKTTAASKSASAAPKEAARKPARPAAGDRKPTPRAGKDGKPAKAKEAARPKPKAEAPVRPSGSGPAASKDARAKERSKGKDDKSRAQPKVKTPAPAKDPPRRRLSPKALLPQLMERLDRAFGAIEQPEARDLLERAVYLVLREGGTPAANERALQSLREDFVDWNEVRLSSPSEVSRLLANSGKSSVARRFHDRARRIGELIDQIYNDRNDPSLEFLLEQKSKEQLEFLEDLEDLGVHNAYALVQWLSGEDRLTIVSKEMAEVAFALGLTDSAAVTKVRKDLSELVPKEHKALLVSLQAHLNQLGNMDRSEWPGSLKEFLA